MIPLYREPARGFGALAPPGYCRTHRCGPGLATSPEPPEQPPIVYRPKQDNVFLWHLAEPLIMAAIELSLWGAAAWFGWRYVAKPLLGRKPARRRR